MSKTLESLFEEYRALPPAWKRYASKCLDDIIGDIHAMMEEHKKPPEIEAGAKEMATVIFNLSKPPKA